MSEKENSKDVKKEEAEIKEEIVKNNKELDDVVKELEKTKEMLLRTAAEYDNYRKRSEKEKNAIYSNAISFAVNAILPLADSLDAALEASKNESEEYKKGIELLTNQMKSSLEKLNVESFGKINEDFDPNIHNAISHIEEETEKQNFISSVFQKGYKIGEKIVRHAMVQVTN